MIRELNPENEDLCSTIYDMGLAKIELPDNNIIFTENKDTDTYFASLNKKQRYKLRKEVYPKIEDYQIDNEVCNIDELKFVYQMYLQTKSRKLELNTFDLPYKFFEEANNSKDWEILRIFHKNFEEPLSMGICYRNNNEYCAVVFGMNKKESLPDNLYKKTIYLVVKHAINNGADIIHLGITAEQTKHMFGAKRIKQVGYGILKDNYNALLLDSMEG